MANITPLNGGMKLPQAWPIIDENVRKVNAEVAERKAEIVAHVDDTKAHAAEHIEIANVEGAANVAEAFDKQRARIEQIISNSGDDITEIVDSRHDTVTATTYPTLGARLNALTDYLNFMPINGGDFDGNNPVGPVIDGGTY